MLLLNGTVVADQMKEKLQVRVDRLKEQGVVPSLATILVGDDPASETYVKMKGNACRRLGMESRKIHLPGNIDTPRLIQTIEKLNGDPKVHGILLQHPVPSHIDERAAFDTILGEKDVDGVTTPGFGRAAFELPGFRSCTPQAIITILDYYGIELEGRHAVVIGRSPILGKPVAHLLLNRHATVTVCHSRTQGLGDIVKLADIVVAAVGKPRLVQGDWIKPGATVIDAGYNPGNVGDVDYDACAAKAEAITPVPGGVGPVTIATLLQHTVIAAELSLQ